uniref:Putative ankyrin repeat protein RF_0381 n=1 Tax=Anthurium amnicola TaxID=1678845 RepID=A0A1D1XZR9_9ARAE
MPTSYFPLRWESTGDQWWYASPIDWAAANGHYDLVRELLHIDNNLLIKLTSLRRIRRLETVWDDDARFVDAARCRAYVARNLLLECEIKNGRNTLIRAGYGGWLLYTAASAGDMSFVRELLDRDPLMVFGEGEYGVTDIFYAAARSGNSEVFSLLLDYAVSPRCLGGVAGALGDDSNENVSVFKWEMVNRAMHAAARGGNLEILKELLRNCSDILAYRDVHGSTVLHAASGRGQVEVVRDLVVSYEIINSRDNQGNTALHVAAFRGHLAVVEALIIGSPTSVYLTNNGGDNFLHMAVAGFRTPGFRRLDRQMELMKSLVCGNLVNIEKLINVRNNDGRTVLHMAVIGNVHSNLVELLMTIKSINLNVRDVDGMTALDLLNQRPRSASSEILIKQLISAGGIANSKDYLARSAIVSHLRLQGFGTSPGTTFKISDAEIFLYTGIEASDAGDRGSGRPSSCSNTSKSEPTHIEINSANPDSTDKKKHNSVKHAAKHLNFLLRWSRRKEKKIDEFKKFEDADSIDSYKKHIECEDTPTPLRQRFSKPTSLQNNKRTLSVRNSMPSPSTKKKFATGLMHGVIQAMPHLARSTRSPSTSLLGSSLSSPISDKQKGVCSEIETGEPSCSNSSVNGGSVDDTSQKSGFANTRLMNQYFCFGAQGLTVEDSIGGPRSSRFFKRSVLSAA